MQTNIDHIDNNNIKEEHLGNKKLHLNKRGNTDCFSYTSKYQDHIPCSFAYKLVCVDDKYSKDVLLYRGKMQFINLFKYL